MNKQAGMIDSLKRTLAAAVEPKNVPTVLAAGAGAAVGGVGASQGIKHLVDNIEADKLDKNIAQQSQEADKIISEELSGKEAAAGKDSIYQALKASLVKAMGTHLPKGSEGAILGATAAVPAAVGYSAAKAKMDESDPNREKMDRIKAYGKRLDVKRAKTPQYLNMSDLLGDKVRTTSNPSAQVAKKPKKVATSSKVDVKKTKKAPVKAKKKEEPAKPKPKKKTSVDKDDPYGSMLKAAEPHGKMCSCPECRKEYGKKAETEKEAFTATAQDIITRIDKVLGTYKEADCGNPVPSPCGPKCSCSKCKKKHMSKQAQEVLIEAFQAGYLV